MYEQELDEDDNNEFVEEIVSKNIEKDRDVDDESSGDSLNESDNRRVPEDDDKIHGTINIDVDNDDKYVNEPAEISADEKSQISLQSTQNNENNEKTRQDDTTKPQKK